MSGAASSAGASRFQAFMNHPAGVFSQRQCDFYDRRTYSVHSSTGPKTVFFWAPLMKWCLVIAGLKDLSRPADKLSVSQNVGSYLSPMLGSTLVIDYTLLLVALAATGFIWVRYSLVITPINYSLAAVRLPIVIFIAIASDSFFSFQVNFFVGSSGLTQLYRIYECVFFLFILVQKKHC